MWASPAYRQAGLLALQTPLSVIIITNVYKDKQKKKKRNTRDCLHCCRGSANHGIATSHTDIL